MYFFLYFVANILLRERKDVHPHLNVLDEDKAGEQK